MRADDLPWTLRHFAPHVYVNVSPERISFARNGVSQTYRTFLYICDSAQGPEVLAVGQEVPDAPDARRVELFGGAAAVSGDTPERMVCLEAFLRFGLQRGAGRSFLRPVVTVRGVENLSAILGGYEQGIFRAALVDAGAAVVLFE
ncbi:MAG: hypothetical protein HY270_16890 [Deltaproteobacteria bacterium]|nr:hypothetical protein [Deltaproteobacteria bacterium]